MFYGSYAGFVAYHVARGRDDADSMDQDDVEPALLVASEWIDNKRAAFPGWKVGGRAQEREWPRYSAYDIHGHHIPSEGVPVEIERAAYEAAYRQVKTPGILSVDWMPNKYKRVSVDGAVSVEFAQFGSAAEVQQQFAIIDQILAPILTGQGDFAALSGPSVRA